MDITGGYRTSKDRFFGLSAPRTVLDEWLRLGVARIDDEERVHLQVDAFVPESGFDEKAFFFGRNTRDHLAAAAHNLRGESPPLPDRAVYYGGLSREATEELRELAERAGMQALQQVNRRARELKGDGGGEQRMTLGFYFFRGPDEDPETPEPIDPASTATTRSCDARRASPGGRRGRALARPRADHLVPTGPLRSGSRGVAGDDGAAGRRARGRRGRHRARARRARGHGPRSR